ncbi:hypothetical protein B7492_23790 [Bacillus mycoides]|uniref:DUF2290 domain-containing protein n=1 Tax=Bacillus mycoides TaxID=1405 RepID=A0A1W6ADU7_BACMY|nr:DUF2290 domain-containing protein [Bacillus mycoides]ARJ24038.1 hypothetical protein B7492_23790 [Bacillus mycoides]
MNPKDTIKELGDITGKVISLGLSLDQNFPTMKQNQDGSQTICWGDTTNISIALKNISYRDIYDELEKNRLFNFKFIDGALVQIMYTFDKKGLISHRLAFFPSYSLESYQNDPELYTKEDLYADILAKSIVPVPIRFDFNRDDDLHIEVEHAKSHVTFGQYQNCRIPVLSPLSPGVFIDFILRNFYSTIHKSYAINLTKSIQFDKTITSNEEKILHFNMI